MTFDFSNKNILITGGSRGIGKACAVLFARYGANIIITYKSQQLIAQQTIAELNPGNHSAYQLDVDNPAAIEGLYAKLTEEYKHIDVLVNNAGIYLEH